MKRNMAHVGKTARLKKLICPFSVVVFASVLLPAPLFAEASEWISAHRALSTVRDVSDISSVVDDAQVTSEGDVGFFNTEQTIVVDANTAALGISSSSEGYAFSVKLPVENGVKVSDCDSALVLRGEDPSYTTTLEAGEGFFRSCFVINNNNSTNRFPVAFDLPDGVNLYFSKGLDGKEDGSIEGRDEQGNVVLAIAIPWAVDAQRNSVPTHYELADNTLTQVVDCEGLDSASFPVVADPTVSFSTWFEGYKWRKVKTLKSSAWKGNKTGWSLSLTPSMALKVATVALPLLSLGQPVASSVTGAAFVNSAWSQAYAKCHKSSHWKNTKSLKQQFYCHFYLLAAKRVTQGSWLINIEPSRPAVGLAKNIAANCNP